MSFLEENAKKEGVVVTDSGLQYKVLESGEGNTPTASDTVSVHYEGRFINGDVFDSSIERGVPTEFGVTQVIKGWVEALQLMKEGDKWEIYVPSNLAYGEGGMPPRIGSNEDLIFQIELLGIKVFEPLQITDRAVEEVKRVMGEQSMSLGENTLRVGVQGGGCSGFNYALGFVPSEEVDEDNDVIFDMDGLQVAMDKRIQPMLAGTEIGFQDGLQGRGFVFSNPNATGGCGCGSSFSTDERPSQSSGSGCGSCPSAQY